MINEAYKYSEITSKIIGCAITVHKTLGKGFQEVIYQRELEFGLLINFGETSLNFKRLTNKKFGKDMEDNND
ncbi:MAG: hypothetical protein IPL26_02095 [Leptospiraceae bacterium]|nr:hypothetical protein [Leptospiraceae bacterium]